LFLRERDARQEQAKLRLVAEQATANEVRLREDAKAGDQVTQAAVFLRYNNVEQADKLLDGLPAERVPRSLEAANNFMAVANWNLEQKRWKVAVERFYSLVHALVGVDMSDSERISFDFLTAVTAVCEWGEPMQYNRLRTLTIERFTNSANPIVAEQVIKATLLEPADETILRNLVPLAGVIEASLSGPKRERNQHMVAWRQFSLGIMAYRQGRLEAAADWAHRSLATASNSAPRAISNQLILAMIDLQKGRTATAHAALADLRHEVDQWSVEPFLVVNPDGTRWYNQGAVRILLKEAEKMLAKSED
jgi:tetratricopeptide (TPR) repeat protein